MVDTLIGHTEAINTLDSIYYETTSVNQQSPLTITLVCSSSADSSIKIWSRCQNSNFNNDQTISSKSKGFALSLKLILLPLTNCK